MKKRLKKFIVDPKGQYNHPGKNTYIPNAKGSITMKGVPYPVLGIDDQGNQQMMYPNEDYQFPGNGVYEIPMAQNGGTFNPDTDEFIEFNDELPQSDSKYNQKRADELGYKPDETGHLPSVDYTNGMWLKSKEHPTAWMEYLYGYTLNPELNKNTNVVINPEGYFGKNQLQYINKKYGGAFNPDTDEFIGFADELPQAQEGLEKKGFDSLSESQKALLQKGNNLDKVKGWYEKYPDEMQNYKAFIDQHNADDYLKLYDTEKEKFDESVKNNADWHKDWYAKRAQLPQFKDVATQRLNNYTDQDLESTTLVDPVNFAFNLWKDQKQDMKWRLQKNSETGKFEVKPVDRDSPPSKFEFPTDKLFGEYDPSTKKVLVNSKLVNQGYYDVNGKLYNQTVTHENDHKQDYDYPQEGTTKNISLNDWKNYDDNYSKYLLDQEGTYENPRKDPLQDVLGYNNIISDNRTDNGKDLYQYQPKEVRTRLDVWRQYNNIDALKQYSEDEIRSIIQNNSKDPNTPRNIKELYQTIDNPSKLRYLHNSYVSNDKQSPLDRFLPQNYIQKAQTGIELIDWDNAKKYMPWKTKTKFSPSKVLLRELGNVSRYNNSEEGIIKEPYKNSHEVYMDDKKGWRKVSPEDYEMYKKQYPGSDTPSGWIMNNKQTGGSLQKYQIKGQDNIQTTPAVSTGVNLNIRQIDPSVKFAAPKKSPYEQLSSLSQEAYNQYSNTLSDVDKWPQLSGKTINLTTDRYRGANVPVEYIDMLTSSAKKFKIDPYLLYAIAGRESTFGQGTLANKQRNISPIELVSGWNIASQYEPYDYTRFLADNRTPSVKTNKNKHGYYYSIDSDNRDSTLNQISNYITDNDLIDKYKKKLESTPKINYTNPYDFLAEFIIKNGVDKYNPGDPDYKNKINNEISLLKKDSAFSKYVNKKQNGGSLEQYQKKGQVVSYPSTAMTYNDNRSFFDSHAVLNDNPRYNEWLKKNIYEGNIAYDPNTGMSYPLNKKISIPEGRAERATEAYTKKGVNQRLNTNKDARRDVVTQSMIDVGSNPLFYAPGAIAATPFIAPAAATVGAAMSAPMSIGSVALPITGLDALGLGFGMKGASQLTNDLSSGYYGSDAPTADKIARGIETGLDIGFSPGVIQGLGTGVRGLGQAGKYIMNNANLGQKLRNQVGSVMLSRSLNNGKIPIEAIPEIQRIDPINRSSVNVKNDFLKNMSEEDYNSVIQSIYNNNKVSFDNPLIQFKSSRPVSSTLPLNFNTREGFLFKEKFCLPGSECAKSSNAVANKIYTDITGKEFNVGDNAHNAWHLEDQMTRFGAIPVESMDEFKVGDRLLMGNGVDQSTYVPGYTADPNIRHAGTYAGLMEHEGNFYQTLFESGKDNPMYLNSIHNPFTGPNTLQKAFRPKQFIGNEFGENLVDKNIRYAFRDKPSVAEYSSQNKNVQALLTEAESYREKIKRMHDLTNDEFDEMLNSLIGIGAQETKLNRALPGSKLAKAKIKLQNMLTSAGLTAPIKNTINTGKNIANKVLSKSSSLPEYPGTSVIEMESAKLAESAGMSYADALKSVKSKYQPRMAFTPSTVEPSKGMFRQKFKTENARTSNFESTINEDEVGHGLSQMSENYNIIKKLYPDATPRQLIDLTTLMWNSPGKAKNKELVDFFLFGKNNPNPDKFKFDYVTKVKNQRNKLIDIKPKGVEDYNEVFRNGNYPEIQYQKGGSFNPNTDEFIEYSDDLDTYQKAGQVKPTYLSPEQLGARQVMQASTTNVAPVAPKLQASQYYAQAQKDISNIKLSDDDFRKKYGTNKHTWQMKTDPQYKAQVEAEAIELAKRNGTIDLPSSNMFSKSYAGNPNLNYMIPNGLTGDARRSYEESQMNVVGAALPIPGLQQMGRIPSIGQALGTETGLLSNVYKINPWAERLNDANKSYRVAGLDAFEDFKNTGILRSQRILPENATFLDRVAARSTGFPSFQKGYADMAYAPKEGAVIFETGLPTFKRGEINPITGRPIKGGHYAHRVINPETGVTMSQIPGKDIRVFNDKPNWLMGYEQLEIPNLNVNSNMGFANIRPNPEQLKDAYGFLRRRQFIKELQKQGLIGKNFEDLNYAARSTDKTNALTKLALEKEATRFRGVEGSVPKSGKGTQEYTGYNFDMSKPAWGNEISEFENMINAGVDFNDPISIAKYQAVHIPMEQYGYRSGMPTMKYVDALYTGSYPTGYGKYMFKLKSPRDFSTGNYQDWFNKYHNLKSRDFNKLAVKDGYYNTSFIPENSYDLPVLLDRNSVVGKKGQKMFDIDESYPFMNYKNLNKDQQIEYNKYLKKLKDDWNTGWKGQYQKGGTFDPNIDEFLSFVD